MQRRFSFLNPLCFKPEQLRRNGRFSVRHRLKNIGGPLMQQIIRWRRKFLCVADNSTDGQQISESSLKQAGYNHIISYPANRWDLNTHAEVLYFERSDVLGVSVRVYYLTFRKLEVPPH
jgi:hypothetical protein